MQKRYPHQLSYGANNPVIALNEKEVAKIFSQDTRSDIGSEAEKMKFANAVNDLVVKLVRIDYDEKNKSDILVMERIYPIDYRSFEVEKRELWLDVFKDEIKQLHQAGFVHRAIRRPSNITGDRFDNVLLTNTGLRLIDVGISAIRKNVGEKLFAKYIEIELAEIEIFGSYFTGR